MARVVIFVSFISILGFIGVSNIITANVSALSLNMTIPKSLNLSVNPNANNGFGESESGEISISTDNISGYTLKVNSKNSSNDLVNPLASSEKLTSITESLTLDEYKNGKGDNKYFNTWAFKPSHINNETNTNFVPGPDNTTGITLAKTEEENSTIPATYAVAIASKVDNTIPAGNYSNTFILTATANELHYTINYDSASLSGATNAGSFTTQTGVIAGSTQQISTATPTRNDATFLGWCSQPLESDGSCKGVTAQPGSYYPMCKCDTDVKLYAIWEKKENSTANFKCTSLSIGGTSSITDDRDGNTYAVAKLNDGKCWMTQNLRLGDSKLTNRTLTSSDSDVASEYTLPESSTSGFSSDSAQNIFVDSNTIYGGYYTWPAATAGTNPSSGEASHSICPKGWRLPTAAEFDTLASKYDYNTIQQSLANFVLAGDYYESLLSGSGTRGSWWSSTANASYLADYLLLYPSSKYFRTGDSNFYKRSGYSIRCVSRE